MSVSVCLTVCLSVREHISGTTRPIFNFLCTLLMAAAGSFSGSIAICYVFPVYG